MTQIDINTSLTKIEFFWQNISKESSDDPDAYGYIAAQAVFAGGLRRFNLT